MKEDYRMNKKSTKRSLLFSVLALILCCALLAGTTLAWFTDTASTSVNKIQAGTLDIALEMKQGNDWVNAENATLRWVRAGDNGTTELVDSAAILWEPGCTYTLQDIRVANEGSLYLKYKIAISGIVGSAKLLEAIEWTVNGQPFDAEAEYNLEPETQSAALTIQGHMKEDAGNEYQGLSIDGIGITVSATQYTAEFDSFSDQYDAAAPIPASSSAKGDLKVNAGGNIVAEERKISDSVMAVTYPAGVKLNTSAAQDENEVAVAQELKYVDNTPQGPNVTLDDGQTAEAYELTLPVAGDNNVLVPVKIQRAAGLTGLKVYHNGVKLTTTASTTEEYYEYDSNTGMLTLYLFHASPIDFVYDAPVAAVGTKVYYDFASAWNAVNAGETLTLLKDVNLNSVLQINKSVVINGQGHNIFNTANRVIRITQPNLDVKMYNLGIISMCTATSDVRGISFDDTASNVSLLLDGCTVSASFYAINIIPGPQKLNVTIKNGTVAAGWAAINCYANNSTFTIENSTLRGLNDKGESSWNNFATIVFDGNGLREASNVGKHGSGNTMNITNSTIFASSESSNNQAWLAVQYGAWNEKITVDAATKIMDNSSNDQSGNITWNKYVGNGSKTYDVHSLITINGTQRQYCSGPVAGKDHVNFGSCTTATEAE